MPRIGAQQPFVEIVFNDFEGTPTVGIHIGYDEDPAVTKVWLTPENMKKVRDEIDTCLSLIRRG